MSMRDLVVKSVERVLQEYGIAHTQQHSVQAKDISYIQKMNEMGMAGGFRICQMHRDERGGGRNPWIVVIVTLYNPALHGELEIKSARIDGEFDVALPVAVNDLYKKFLIVKRNYSS